MEILKHYYTTILRLNEVMPMLNDKLNENKVMKKLCSTTLVCCNETDDCITTLELSNNSVLAANLMTFQSLLKEVEKSLTSNDVKCICRLSKLNSSAWKNLHKICGDFVLRQLFSSFDIFEAVSGGSLNQLVGYPLNLRKPFGSVSRKRKRFYDQKSRKDVDQFVTRKRLTGFNWFSARQFVYSRDLRDSIKGGLFKFWTSNDEDDNNLSTALELIKDVFDLNSAVVINAVTPMFLDLIKTYKRNHFRGLLDHYCPLPDGYSKAPLKFLAQQHLPSTKVRSYIRAILSSLIPVELLGCKNLATFITNLSDKIVEFRRYDQCNLRQFVDGFKVKDCAWIRCAAVDESSKHSLVASLMQFLLRFVVHVVRKSFYVTESQCLKNKLLFYRKPLWTEVVKRGSVELMKQCQLSRITRNRCRINTTQFGPFGLRFVPKFGSVRPILANCDNEHRVEKMNNLLKPVVAVLQCVLAKNRSLAGSAIVDFDDIYLKWAKFIDSNRYSSSYALRQPLYFVKIDVNACFDSILHTVLINILENKLKPSMDLCYAVHQYCTVSFKNGKIFRIYRHIARPVKQRFDKRLTSTIGCRRKQSISVVKNDQSIISSLNVLDTLKTLIANHVLKVMHKFYRQNRGIAQGSAVSKILCDLYLAQMERDHMTYVDETDLLMRHVDDFLLVTPTKQKSVDFLKLLLNGVPEFGIRSSADKVVTNFNDEQLNQWFLITDGNERGIPWCGLLFQPSTGEICIDDNRWRVLDVRDLLTVNYGVNADEHVKSKLLSYLSARTFRVCFDKHVNSLDTLKRTINSLVLFSARCYDSFKFAYGPKRLRLTPEEAGALVARKIIDLVAKFSPSVQRRFTIKGVIKSFCTALKR